MAHLLDGLSGMYAAGTQENGKWKGKVVIRHDHYFLFSL
jgi:hypothetical protein